MAWFRRQQAGIHTASRDRNDVPEGQWSKCPGCGEIVNSRQLEDNLFVCPKCSYHHSISSTRYFELLFDDAEYERFDADLLPVDALDFVDRKAYATRLRDAQAKTELNDAAQAAMGRIGGRETSVAAMDFSFIGGSMGSVVGEIIARSIKRAYTEAVPAVIISQSGGARMMEGALSLMQMAKTSVHLAKLADMGLPYISVMTNPTTGGVTASFAMLGDVNIAEPNALIGFAGPRVIRETMGQDLPEGFQRSEFLQQQGFVDAVIDRRQLKSKIVQILDLLLEAA